MLPLDAPPARDDGAEIDCPVCLEDTRFLSGQPVTIPCCRKVYCRQCIVALVGAQKGNPPVGADGVAKWMAHTLVCPTCREEHHVPGGRGEKWADRLALDSDPSKWGGTALLSEAQKEVDGTLCSALSREELVAVCCAGGKQHYSAARAELAQLDRTGLVAEAARRLGSSSAEGLRVSELSVRAARCVLTMRGVPFADCLEKSELTQRVEQCHRGSCSRLPTKLLKQMLVAEGLGDETYEDKENLARRLMAVRALRRGRFAELLPADQPALQLEQPAAQQAGRRPPATPARGGAGRPALPARDEPLPDPERPPSATLRPNRSGWRQRPSFREDGCQCVVS